MVSKDRFSSLEMAISDRNLFSHIGVALCTFGFTLGIEMGVTWALDPQAYVAQVLTVVCVGVGVLGIISLLGARGRGTRIEELKNNLFDTNNLISDQTVLYPETGSPVMFDNLTSGSSQPQRSQGT